jgi:hypothetical protein
MAPTLRKRLASDPLRRTQSSAHLGLTLGLIRGRQDLLQAARHARRAGAGKLQLTESEPDIECVEEKGAACEGKSKLRE